MRVVPFRQEASPCHGFHSFLSCQGTCNLPVLLPQWPPAPLPQTQHRPLQVVHRRRLPARKSRGSTRYRQKCHAKGCAHGFCERQNGRHGSHDLRTEFRPSRQSAATFGPAGSQYGRLARAPCPDRRWPRQWSFPAPLQHLRLHRIVIPGSACPAPGVPRPSKTLWHPQPAPTPGQHSVASCRNVVPDGLLRGSHGQSRQAMQSPQRAWRAISEVQTIPENPLEGSEIPCPLRGCQWFARDECRRERNCGPTFPRRVARADHVQSDSD